MISWTIELQAKKYINAGNIELGELFCSVFGQC